METTVMMPQWKREAILEHIDIYTERRKKGDRWTTRLEELKKLTDILYSNQPDLVMHRIKSDHPNSITNKDVMQILNEEIVFLELKQ